MEKQKIYVVQLDWSTEDNEGNELELFDTKEKALKKFNEIIKEEKTMDYYLGKDAFDKNGNLLTDEYNLDTNIDNPNALEFYWELRCTTNFYLHDSVQLLVKEVN